MDISSKQLVLLYIGYYIASILLYAITASGWNTIFTPLFYSLVFYWPLGICLIAILGLWLLRSQKSGRVPKKLLIATLVLQAATLVLNSNDCGDSGNDGFLFFQRFLGVSCGSEMVPQYASLWRVSSIAFIMYMLGSLIIVYHLAKTPAGLVTTRVKALWKRIATFFLWAVIALMTILPLIWVINFIEGLS